MDPMTIISVAIALINQGTKAIAAAQNGDLEEAKKALDEATAHYRKSSDAWDAAKAPEANG